MTNCPDNNSVSGMKNVLLFIGRSKILQIILTLDHLDGYFFKDERFGLFCIFSGMLKGTLCPIHV